MTAVCPHCDRPARLDDVLVSVGRVYYFTEMECVHRCVCPECGKDFIVAETYEYRSRGVKEYYSDEYEEHRRKEHEEDRRYYGQ